MSPNKVKFLVEIPEDTRKRLRVFCANCDLKMNWVVNEAINEYITEVEEDLKANSLMSLAIKQKE